MMANDIGAYFACYPSHDEAVEGIANHLRSFWEARMRRDIVDYVANGGGDLKPLVREAVLTMTRKFPASSEEVGDR